MTACAQSDKKRQIRIKDVATLIEHREKISPIHHLPAVVNKSRMRISEDERDEYEN